VRSAASSAEKDWQTKELERLIKNSLKKSSIRKARK
jgi:hypothetical protein